MNRGSDKDYEILDQDREPSMRPRFMNRGSPTLLGSRPNRLVPSMRPRFMNRGSADKHHVPALRQSAFNEAPIHESGK